MYSAMRTAQQQTIEQEVGSFTIEDTVTLLWPGWECDEHAWLIRTTDDRLHFVATSHGRAFLTDATWLQGHIEETLEYVNEQQSVLQRLQNQ
jgi:hypothetical protein